jgi:hypothetical protein
MGESMVRLVTILPITCIAVLVDTITPVVCLFIPIYLGFILHSVSLYLPGVRSPWQRACVLARASLDGTINANQAAVLAKLRPRWALGDSLHAADATAHSLLAPLREAHVDDAHIGDCFTNLESWQLDALYHDQAKLRQGFKTTLDGLNDICKKHNIPTAHSTKTKTLRRGPTAFASDQIDDDGKEVDEPQAEDDEEGGGGDDDREYRYNNKPKVPKGGWVGEEPSAEMDATRYPLQITGEDLELALELVLPGLLLTHARVEGRKAVTKVMQSCKTGDIGELMKLMRREDQEPQMRFKAGLQFLPPPIHNFLVARMAFNVHPLCSVYLAAVLEYLTAEILELGGNKATEMQSSRITPETITQAIDGDPELRRMMLPHATTAGDWSWRQRYTMGGLATLPPIQPLSHPSDSLRPFGWPHYLRFSLAEHVCRSLDYLAMAGLQSARIKLQEDLWRRQYLNAYYSGSSGRVTIDRSHESKSDTKTMVNIASSGGIGAPPSWQDILIDVYDPAEAQNFLYTRPSTSVFPTEKVSAASASAVAVSSASLSGAVSRYAVPTVLRLAKERTAGDHATVAQADFESRWNELSEGMFNGFDWNNVFAAGGSILACLQPTLELKTYRTDFDLFIYGLDEVHHT